MPDRSGRSERSAAVALTAWLLLALLVVGAPLGLAYFIGWPLSAVSLPHGLPRDPWTTHTLLRWIYLLVWSLWAQFTACVVVEIRAALTGTEVPVRLPGAAASRTVARALVAVALTASVAGATATAASARPVAVAVTPNGVGYGARGHVPLHGAQPAHATQTSVVNSAPSAPFASITDNTAPLTDAGPRNANGYHAASETLRTYAAAGAPFSIASSAETVSAAALKFYVVEPPGGRRHDSLWEIAQRYLGDGRRYREIFALNEGRLQPDGTKLQHASLIRPGWVLVLPADAQGPGLSEQLPPTGAADPPAQSAPAPPAAGPAPAGLSAPTAAPHNGSAVNGTAPKTYAMPGDRNANGNAASEGLRPGGSAPVSAIPHPVASRPAVPKDEPAGQHADEASVLHSIADVLPYVALIGSPILAAALLTALTAAARRRRREHPAASIVAPPDPAVAEVERTIRAAASHDTADVVDRSLRALRAGCEAAGRVPPAVRYGRADADDIRLELAEPDPRAPAPWTALGDGAVWRYARQQEPDPETEPSRRHAVPYPLLLAIGSLGDEQVFVDLESSSGRCTAVTGPPRQRRAVLAAAAASLACAPWADQLRIETVGLPAELALLAPERLRVHPDLAGALAALEQQAAATGPHLVRLLIAEGAGPEETARLRALTASADSGTAALVGTDHPWPDFTVFGVDPAGRLRIPGVSGDLTASRLPDALAAALGALFRAAAAPRYAPAYRPADVPLAGGVELLDRPVGVRACILGPVELTGVRPADAARGPLFTEALILLLFHRAGLPAPVLARALWPRGITPAARDRMLRDMRDWLGEDHAGPRLTVGPDGLVRLTEDVRADWDEFQAAYADASRLGDRPEADEALARALALVRGELLADRPPGRYSWLGFGTQETEVPAVVADAAHRLATRRLARGDAAGAQWAAQQGLLGAPDDERLVQIKIRGIAAQGDQDRLHDVIADLKVRAWYRYGETELHPSTNAVVSELLEGLRA
ncbi:LysM peptidoglycan-binding domain-containing protein [Actinocrinis puniceicyclus]|uniref:LysM peptidoglycan-binding domain-containing protein n=1 Tax=Actinocrinis puniceicyclus TaxID=977794 RepID=A0A8J8BEF4_9ACTN|nr:LysM peptidoglycan-binding domain-containing protein [Actinocrinis puniceicyclus]MBS2965485.1 LysM peptidoglycan-binding domain-containing protein [Actinocrinis puniceicyclus]